MLFFIYQKFNVTFCFISYVNFILTFLVFNMAGINICPKCEQVVRPKQHGIQCDDCRGWFHRICIPINHSSYMTQERYREIGRNKENFDWLCDCCDRPYIPGTNDVSLIYNTILFPFIFKYSTTILSLINGGLE